MKLRVALTALVAVATTSVAASAQQPWIKDRRFGEGIGIRAGNLEIHPGIAAEGGYDSNYFQRADNAEEPRVGFYRLRITPHVTVSTLGPQRRLAEGLGESPVVSFRAGAFLAYNELFNAGDSHGTDGSDYRHVSLGANFLADFLPDRPIGVDLYGDYLRAVEPSNSPDEDFAFNRDSMRLGTGLNWRPGGGLFTWRAGYEINYHLFEKDAFEGFNNARHYIKTRARWRFLPRTALISDADYGIIRFSNDTTQNDGETLQGRVGINGLVTNHFALLGMAGWAATFYDRSSNGTKAQNYDGPIGQAEVKWFIMPAPSLEASSAAVGLSSIALGYNRGFATSYLGSFNVRDRGYLNFTYFIGGLFVVGAEGGLSRVTYPRTFYAPSATTPADTQRKESFGETRVDVQAFGEYRFSDTFALNATVRYDQNMSERVPYAPGANAPSDDLDFKRVQAYLGVRLFY